MKCSLTKSCCVALALRSRSFPRLSVCFILTGILFLSGCTYIFGAGPTLHEKLIASAGLRLVEEVSVIDLSHPKSVATTSEISGETLDVPEEGGVSTHEIGADSFYSAVLHRDEVVGLAPSFDGLRLFSAGSDGSVVLSELVNKDGVSVWSRKAKSQPRLRKTVMLRGERPLTAIALSPREEYLALSWFSSVAVFELSSRRFIAQLTAVEGRISALSWDPRGQLLALGTATGDTYIWRPFDPSPDRSNNLRSLELYQGATSSIVSLQFTPNGRSFFVAEKDRSASLWRLLRTERELGLDKVVKPYEPQDQIQMGRESIPLEQVKGQVRGAWLSPDGTLFFLVTDEGQLNRYKVRGLRHEAWDEVSRDSVLGISGLISGVFSNKQWQEILMLATSDREQRVKFWCAEGGRPIYSSVRLQDPVQMLSASAGSGVLWGIQKTGSVVMFDSSVFATKALSAPLKSCLNQSP